MGRLLLMAVAVAAVAMSSCGGSATSDGGSADSTASRSADSAMADEALRVRMADSLRRDSLMRDSLAEVNSLKITDFVKVDGGVPEYLAEHMIVDRLKGKGFAVDGVDRVAASYDADDPEGTDFKTVVNYRFSRGEEPSMTTVAVKWSETYWPVTINFTDDRDMERFVASLAEAGFEKDMTGNYAHGGNTEVTGVTVVCSGRRAVIERIWSY